MAKYKKMLNTSKLIHEYITKGKKIKEGKTIKAQMDQDKEVKDTKPPWRSTGVSNMPTYTKPSKYQRNNEVKAKVFTGLGESKPNKMSDLYGNS
jgi:hypothetical protein